MSPRLSVAVARVGDVLLWVTAILGTLAVAASLLLVATGGRPVVVTSGSMGDAYPVGSVTVVRRVAPGAVALGDVLSVRQGNGTKTLHRVVEVQPTPKGVVVRTKGDANGSPDTEPVLLIDAWRAGASVPVLGRVAVVFRSPLAGFALAVVLLAPLALGDRRRAAPPVPGTAPA